MNLLFERDKDRLILEVDEDLSKGVPLHLIVRAMLSKEWKDRFG